MLYRVSNTNSFDILFCVGEVSQKIAAHEVDVEIDSDEKEFLVKRYSTIPAPDFNRRVKFETWGFPFNLFFGEYPTYVLDISSCYKVAEDNNEIVNISVGGDSRYSDVGSEYKTVIALSDSNRLFYKYHRAENGEEVLDVYRRVQKKIIKTRSILLEVLMVLGSMITSYPIIILLKISSGYNIFLALLAVVPLLTAGMVALLGIWPMVALSKHSEAQFASVMESDRIRRRLLVKLKTW